MIDFEGLLVTTDKVFEILVPKILRRNNRGVREEVVHNSCTRFIRQVEAEVVFHTDDRPLQRSIEVDVHGLSQVSTLKVVDGRAALGNAFTDVDAKDVLISFLHCWQHHGITNSDQSLIDKVKSIHSFFFFDKKCQELVRVGVRVVVAYVRVYKDVVLFKRLLAFIHFLHGFDLFRQKRLLFRLQGRAFQMQ